MCRPGGKIYTEGGDASVPDPEFTPLVFSRWKATTMPILGFNSVEK